MNILYMADLDFDHEMEKRYVHVQESENVKINEQAKPTPDEPQSSVGSDPLTSLDLSFL